MLDMPRPRPPHLHVETTRHGRRVWYVRVGHGPRTRLRELYGTEAFWTAYRAAVAGEAGAARAKPGKGSLSWLVEQYRQSQDWMRLAPSTRRVRDAILRGILDTAGAEPFTDIDRAAIIAGRDRRAARPASARHFVDVMRGLFSWALDAQHVTVDPTQGVKVRRPASDGFHVWSEDEIEAFEKRWPLGTRERVALDLLLYTGLRRGDVVRLGRPHVRNGIATIRMEKTGDEVSFRILPPLQATLAAGPCGDLTFIARHDGRPMVKEGFGNWFRDACKAAGVPGSAHGLRKAGATRAAENGATEAELMALFGWSDPDMARVYTRTANRKRMALASGDKLATARNENGLFPHPADGAGQKRKNS